MSQAFGWTDIEDIAIALHEAHPGVDPFEATFPDLRRLVERLDGFRSDPEHNVNEQILEAIQVAWQEEIDEAGENDGDADRESGYSPNNPYR